MKKLEKTLADSGIIAGTFALLSVLTYYICAPSLCFLEQTATYIDHRAIIGPMLARPGGYAAVWALWLRQWFVTPWAAALIIGALLTVVALSLSRIIGRLTVSRGLMPLSLIPTFALISAHGVIDYRPEATVAVAMATVCLLPVGAFRRGWTWLVIPLAGSVVLSVMAGPVAMLFAVCAAIISLAMDPKKGLLSLAGIPAAAAMSFHAYLTGAGDSLMSTMLPWGYYPHWHSGSGADLASWIAITGVILAAAVLRIASNAGSRRLRLLPVVSSIVTAGALAWTVYTGCLRRTDSFATMWLHSSAGEWDAVVAGFKEVDKENATMQNFVNLAMAEKGTLCDYLFWHPNNGVAALHNTGQKSPYTYMLLSDVYYSMGFIALAKRYAFEANEALGNTSPQMLKRLADTNIITGDYAVAEKYLDMLSLTGHYSDWAGARRKLLYDDQAVAADPVLGVKRRCIFPSDRFAGSEGIADDMLQVLRSNPAHASTMQYLGAYYMLSRNIPGLVALVEEFYGSPALSSPLPVHFQEALVIDGLINGNGIDPRYNIHPSVLERCRAFWAEHQPQPNTLWHYLRQK